jgi:hypothetical protein
MLRKFLLVFFVLANVTFAEGQRLYFVYLQTDNGEPFFVTMDEKISSSTATGYLILPRLRDSTYNIKLGFPGKEMDLSFTININQKDHGFIVKNFGEKGWGLYDIQSLNIQMSNTKSRASAVDMNNGNAVSPFTDLLSRAVDDASLRQPVIVIEEKKPATEEKKIEEPVVVKNDEKKETVISPEVKPGTGSTLPVEKKDMMTVSEVKNENKPVNTPPVEQKDTVAVAISTVTPESKLQDQPVVYQRSVITRISSSHHNGGGEMVFVDQLPEGGQDTIRILVPEANSLPETPVKEPVKKEEKKFLDIMPDSTHQEISKPDSALVQKPVIIIKPCTAVANDNDFLKLRRKMAEKTNDEGMITEGKKYFRIKCFTTEQVRNLSSMFLSPAGKFHFYEAAYEHISDRSNIPGLASELKDDYYTNRFKALSGN